MILIELGVFLKEKPEFEHRGSYSRQSRKVSVPVEMTFYDFKKNQSNNLKEEEPQLNRRYHTAWTRVIEVKGRFCYLLFFVISVVISLTFYSFPLLHRLAGSVTSLNLYSGLAMSRGVMPYNNFYGSAGPLFYLLNRLGFAGGTTMLLWVLEIFVLFVSGIFAFKIVKISTDSKRIAIVIANATIIAIAGISMGGDSSLEFALPLVLYGIYVLNSYFIDPMKHHDERFIFYGVAGAVANLIYPLFLVVWVVGFFALLIYNSRKHLLGRGLYQCLASFLGFLAVYSVVGYYTLVSQIFYPAIEQAAILPFIHIHFGAKGWQNFGLSILILLIFGLMTAWAAGIQQIIIGQHRAWAGLLVILALVLLFITSFSNDFVVSNALVVLPFVFLFAGFKLTARINSSGHRISQLVVSYLRSSLALPIFGIFFILVFPFVDNLLNHSTYRAEKEVAAYIKENTDPSDQVLVTTDDKNINRLSDRVSNISLVPRYYPKSFQDTFNTRIGTEKIRFVVVQENQKVPKSLSEVLRKNYHSVKAPSELFKIYEIKK